MLCDLQEAMATSEELGQDLEHVELLQKKFEEFQTDLAAHEERVNEVNQLAAKLTQESHPEAELIVRRQDEVNGAWQRLKGLAQQRQGRLFGAAEVQRFNRWAPPPPPLLSPQSCTAHVWLTPQGRGRDHQLDQGEGAADGF